MCRLKWHIYNVLIEDVVPSLTCILYCAEIKILKIVFVVL